MHRGQRTEYRTECVKLSTFDPKITRFLGLRITAKIVKHFRHSGYTGNDGRSASRDEEVRKRTASDDKLRDQTEQFDQFRREADDRERDLDGLVASLKKDNLALTKRATSAESRGAQDREIAEKRLGETETLRKKMKNSSTTATVEINSLQKQNRHLVSKREEDKNTIAQLKEEVADGVQKLGTVQGKMLTTENHLREVSKIKLKNTSLQSQLNSANNYLKKANSATTKLEHQLREEKQGAQDAEARGRKKAMDENQIKHLAMTVELQAIFDARTQTLHDQVDSVSNSLRNTEAQVVVLKGHNEKLTKNLRKERAQRAQNEEGQEKLPPTPPTADDSGNSGLSLQECDNEECRKKWSENNEKVKTLEEAAESRQFRIIQAQKELLREKQEGETRCNALTVSLQGLQDRIRILNTEADEAKMSHVTTQNELKTAKKANENLKSQNKVNEMRNTEIKSQLELEQLKKVEVPEEKKRVKATRQGKKGKKAAEKAAKELSSGEQMSNLEVTIPLLSPPAVAMISPVDSAKSSDSVKMDDTPPNVSGMSDLSFNLSTTSSDAAGPPPTKRTRRDSDTKGRE